MKKQLALALSILVVSSTTMAVPKAEDQIKFRQSGFMFMRWNMGIIKNQVVKNPQGYNQEQVEAAADVIAAVANSGIISLFTPETAKGKGWKDTKVKPAFFNNPEDVKKLDAEFRKEANALAAMVASGDVVGIKHQFNALLDACKGCHKKYREK